MGGESQIRYEIIEAIIMKFKCWFLWNNRGSEISLRSDLYEIIDIHSDSPCCWESACRIVWLIHESHLFELLHIIANSSRGYIHALISDESFTPYSVSTFDIFPDNKSENLDFSDINTWFARHFWQVKINNFLTEIFCKNLPQGFHGNFPMRSNT